jgi:hypothetical protein
MPPSANWTRPLRKIGTASLARILTLVAGTALALAGAVSGCGTPTKPPEASDPSGSWLSQAPEGCAIGFSGPTMNPGNAIRNARRSALQSLVSGSVTSSIHIDSTLLTSGARRNREYTRQDIEGSVWESRIVKMWAEVTADPPSSTRVRHVYALACEKGASPPGVTEPDYPDWVMNLPQRPGKTCALAVGGPTWDPSHQATAALEDGQRALAEALESHLRQVIEDDGQRNPRVMSEMKTAEWAVSKAASVDALDAEWLDEDGIGPLGLRKVLYGTVCVAH